MTIVDNAIAHIGTQLCFVYVPMFELAMGKTAVLGEQSGAARSLMGPVLLSISVYEWPCLHETTYVLITIEIGVVMSCGASESFVSADMLYPPTHASFGLLLCTGELPIFADTWLLKITLLCSSVSECPWLV